MLDYCIRNGEIIEGSLKKAYQADIGIKDGKIVLIGNLSQYQAKNQFDAQGLTVCPGFIDIHTHSDATLAWDKRQVSQVRQGVTTQLVGLCGVSFAPNNERSKKVSNNFLASEHSWETYAEYMDYIDNLSPGTNIGGYIGHGTLRSMVLDKPIGQPSAEELEKMCDILDSALSEGAFGLTTGLEYFPGKAAEIYELESLCRIVAKHNKVHACHARNRDAYYCSAISEVIDITRATNVKLLISHINPKYGCHESTMQNLMDLINLARKDGFIVRSDIMPTKWNHTGATALLPLWAAALSAEELSAILAEPQGREKLQVNPTPIWQLAHQGHWDRIYLFSSKQNVQYHACSIEEIATDLKCSPWDALCKILLNESPHFEAITLTSDAFSLDDIRLALSDSQNAVCSDVVGLATDGFLAGRNFSPNVYNWIPKYFKNFITGESPCLTIEEGIQRLTSIPAMQLGIMDRGLISPNYCADIVICEPANIQSQATLRNPAQYPSDGIHAVFVNGHIAWKKGYEDVECYGKALKG